MKFTKEQTRAITESGKNIIVSAGAGSGKTAVLSERVLEKLKNNINIDELLIITFTEAASKEMLNRITEKIKKAGMKEQLDRLDSSYITTFDSFALSIVKKYGHKLNISPKVNIVDNSIMTIKKSEELDQIFEELYKNKDKSFIKLIKAFCIKSDSKLKEDILKIVPKIDKIYGFDFDNYVKNNYSEEIINNRIKEYTEYLLKKIEELNYLKDEMKNYTNEKHQLSLEQELDKYMECKTFDDIKSINISLPRLPNHSEEAVKTINQKIKDILAEIGELTDYDSIEEVKEQLLSTKDHADIIMKILKTLYERIDEYKYTNDLYEFHDIAKLAIKIVKENADIKEELKYRFKEIMVDEYQDTNDLQDIFISEIENNNVYMVGDVKQSIYRFRNANPALFRKKYETYSKGKEGIKIDLNENFRSRKEPIDAINAIFNSIMDNEIGGANYKEEHQLIFGNKAYEENIKENSELEIYNYEPNEFKEEEIEAFIIANDIKEKMNSNYQVFDKEKGFLRDLRYDDIAILIDRSKHFELFKKIFEYLNVPLSIYSEKTISKSEDILIIYNLVALLINDEERFKHAFMSVERSYLFNTKDADIFSIIANNDYENAESIKKIKEIKITTLSETIENLIYQFNFYEKMITVGNIAEHIDTIEYILKKALEQEQLGFTIYDFYKYLKDVLEQDIKIDAKVDKEKNGVKIVTIHKSKGLEYCICYYPEFNKKFNKQDVIGDILFDEEYGLVIPSTIEYIRPTILKPLLKNKFIKEEISERLRLLYVALTRAREKMIIVCPKIKNEVYFDKIPNYIKINYNSFLDVISSVESKLANYIKEVDLEKLNITSDYNKINSHNLNIKDNGEKLEVKECEFKEEYIDNKKMSKEQKTLLNKEEYESINYGTKIHKIFENIDFNNPDYSGLTNFEKTKVDSFINNDIFKNAKKTYKELAIKYEEDNEQYHGVIDLLIEYDNYYNIVDYKLKNIEDEAYNKQLLGYKKYIEKVTDKKCDIYLYSIMDETLKKL